MKLWVYTFAWNEEKILPFFLRHYVHHLGAERVVVYDNESTDNTAGECGRWRQVEVRPNPTDGLYSELHRFTHLRNTCWHEARGRADWVAVVDADEFLLHDDWPGFLERCTGRGVTLVRPYGWEMVAREFPQDDGKSQLWEKVRTGVQSGAYSKPCLFRPAHLTGISYAPGAHDCQAGGNVRYLGSGALRLLHFKRLGWDYFIDRTARLRARSHPDDVRAGHFYHYRRGDQQQREEFESMLRNSVDVTT